MPRTPIPINKPTRLMKTSLGNRPIELTKAGSAFLLRKKQKGFGRCPNPLRGLDSLTNAIPGYRYLMCAR